MKHKYFKYLLNNDPKKVLSPIGIRVRKFFNPLLLAVAPLTCKYKLKVVGRSKLPKNVPIIFAPTHRFKDDVLFSVLTAKKNAYLLCGSLPHFFNSFDGITSWINGTVLVDRTDRESREAVIPKYTWLLRKGGNACVFPEGVWNKTPNLLVLKLYPGAYELAKKTGAVVVPIATHLEGKICYSKMGDPLYLQDYDRKEGVAILRDNMATLIWELMEIDSYAKRSDYDDSKTMDEHWDEYIQSLVNEVAFYDHEVENSIHFQPKDEYSEKDVFAVIDKVVLTNNNAVVVSQTRNYQSV